MALKPLSEPGVPFTVSVTVDHSVTSLFTLPEGSFYTVESLLLDPVTGIPLRPLVDYMYFQQNVLVSSLTGKQSASIIQLRNTDITAVIVKGRYSHGVTQEEIDNWFLMTTAYKDVPKWMNWIACLDDPLQQHPNVKRVVKTPTLEMRTLNDVEVEMNYIADQFENGDKLYISHIQYWQNELFNIAQATYNQYMADLNAFVAKLEQDVSGKLGDFKFTDGDAMRWSKGLRNEYFGTTLRDRGSQAIGTYTYLPEGSVKPSRLTNLFQIVNRVQVIQGVISTDKDSYYRTDTMGITVAITQLSNRVLPNAEVQVVDPADEKVYATFPINDIRAATFNFSLNLQDLDVGQFGKKLIVRVPQYMWLNPTIVNVQPNLDPSIGYVTAELLGEDNVGNVNKGGYVNKIKVKFKRVGTLRTPQRLYVHLSGDYPDSVMKPGYPKLQTFDFPVDFNESTEVVAEFVVAENDLNHYRCGVAVSTVADPLNTNAVIKQNVWYITSVPINPYIDWHFAVKNGSLYERITSVEEGGDVYAIGKLSVDYDLMGVIPQLQVVSKGIGSAIEGVDFIIDRTTVIKIDDSTVAWKISLPFKPEQETTYKFLNVKTINSNMAEMWIVDKVGPADIVGSWHASELLNAPVIDWTSENSTFYLRLKTPGLADGTKLNLSLASPEIYRPYITIPAEATVFSGIAIAQIRIAAPEFANPVQYLKIHVTGPNINYTTLGLMIVDTVKPYYELRFIVNQLTNALTAYPGDIIRCQARCIKDASANGTAAVMLSGTALSSDFVLPAGVSSPLKRTVVNDSDWVDLLVDNLTTKEPMRLDYLTLVTSIIFPLSPEGDKLGVDGNLTLNLRSS